jgi:hypothetical protein
VYTRRKGGKFMTSSGGLADGGKRVLGRQTGEERGPLTKFVRENGAKGLGRGQVHVRRTWGRERREPATDAVTGFGGLQELIKGQPRIGWREVEWWIDEWRIRTPPVGGNSWSKRNRPGLGPG